MESGGVSELLVVSEHQVLGEVDTDRSKSTLGAEILEDSDEINSKTLHKKVRDLFDEINQKRKRDTELLTEYKSSMNKQMEKRFDLIEQNIFNMYTKQGTIIQEKVQRFYVILDNISKLEDELDEFRQSLTVLYADLQKT